VVLDADDPSLDVSYLAYDGSLLHHYHTGPSILDGIGGPTLTTGAHGTVFVAGYHECGGPLNVEKITPDGLAWTWTDGVNTDCHNPSQPLVAATPDGGVLLTRYTGYTGYTGSLGSSLEFTSLSSSGASRWTKPATGLLGDAGTFAEPPVVDQNGTVALPLHYSLACTGGATNCTEVDFVNQANGSTVLPSLHLPQAGATEDLGDSDLAIDTDRVYLVTRPPNSDVVSLSAFSVPGLGKDYRLALQEALTENTQSPKGGDGSSGGTTGGGSSGGGGGGGSTPNPPKNPCLPTHGSIAHELLASLRCTAHLTRLEVACGFGITKLLYLPFKSLKLIKAAKSLSIIDRLPIKLRPRAKFIYDLAHAKYSRHAPRGFSTGAQAVETIDRIKDAYKLIKKLPDLHRAVSAHDFSEFVLDLDDIAGLKSCVQAVADGMAG
jgi:hypothetical protein